MKATDHTTSTQARRGGAGRGEGMLHGYGPSLADQGYSPEDADYPDYCSECDVVLPVMRQEDRRLVGYPGEKPFTEVREYRICSVCGHRQDEEGGWYE